ncbi:MAG: NAD(P)/FAD-dependent oxidoreductase [Myxococcaceae bacterium]|nr:NAD(P)/FAD-dependent oxidoreductase [Myxococcaceae bacterium]
MARIASTGPHVVVVGAGFAGLQVARKLKRAQVHVTVVDHYNHHLFQPLLYQVATATISPGDIGSPIRRVLRGNLNTTVLLAEAKAVDTSRKVVECDVGDLSYDTLVLATGATHSYFGHPEWAEFAPGLKTIDDATEIRRRLLVAFEAAEREPDPEQQREWLTFVIIGGGPTGTELAGAVAFLAHVDLVREYRRIDTRQARILLVEALPRVLTAYPEKLSEHARRDLEKLGVEVRTGSMVTGVDAEGVVMGQERIRARTVLWGAGVAASPLARTLGAELDRAGRVKVTPQLTVPGHDDIYVVGDLASVVQNGRPVPGVAPAAMQMGRHTARNIRRQLEGRAPEPFHYVDKGSFAVIGRNHAVGTTLQERLKLSGFIAWFGWLFIHILYLVGFRNRLAVLLDWGFSYFTHKRSVRLITGGSAAELPELKHREPSKAQPPLPPFVEKAPEVRVH